MTEHRTDGRSREEHETVSHEDFHDILTQTRHFVRSAVVPREQEILAHDKVPDVPGQEDGLFGYAIPPDWGGLG